MRAELKILADVASYRLRRLEMANLAGAAALGVALHVPAGELGLRLVFGLGLNLLVYLNNDFHDRDDDLGNGDRDRSKTAYLLAHQRAAVRAQLGLVAGLILCALWWGGGLWMPLVIGGGVCWAYSAALKHRPFLDVIAMMAWGMAMPLVGVPSTQLHIAWPLLLLLGLFSGVFESVQVLRDVEPDARRGIATTAVVLGSDRTRALVRLLCALAGVHALAAFGAVVALPTIIAAMAPMRGRTADRLWNRMRMLCGLTFLLACAATFGALGFRALG